MMRNLLGALALAFFGVKAVDVQVSSHAASDFIYVPQGIQVLEVVVSEAFADSLHLVSDALDAGSHLQEVMNAAESGSLGQLMDSAPEAAVALNSKVEDDTEGAPGAALDALMKAGKMIMQGVAGSQAPAGDAKGVDTLKALGQMLGGKRDSADMAPAKVNTEDMKKLKDLESKLTSQAHTADGFLTKKGKSSTLFGPASNQAAKAFTGSGQEEMLKKLGRVVGAAQPAAVKRLQAAVDREPDQLLVKKLTNLKHFLDALIPNDPRVGPLRASLETPEGIRRLARFAESVRDVEQGYQKNGEMWGITDEGFEATARLVVASEAMDGQQHEPFSAETAMALKRYMEDHPEEARMSIKTIHERFPNGKIAVKK